MGVSADGTRAEITIWGESVPRVYDLKTGKELHPNSEAHRGQVHGVAITPDGQIVSAGTDNTIRLWDLKSGRHLRAIATDHPLGASTITVSADGRVVASADHNRGDVELHELRTGKLVRRIDTGGQMVHQAAFAPHGKLLAVSADKARPGGGKTDPFLGFWDVEAGHKLREEKVGFYGTMAFDPNGKFIALISADGIRIYDIASGRQQRVLNQKEPRCLAISPDGRILACGDFHFKSVTLWELASGRERGRIETTSEWCTQLCFSPDGRRLARQNKNSVEIWDVRSLKKSHLFAGHDAWIEGLCFTSDSQKLISASFDTTLLVWDMAAVAGRQAKAAPATDMAVREAWNDLGSLDGQVAHRALGSLIDAPAQAAPLMRDQLKPAAPLDAAAVERLLGKLDSDAFAERDRSRKDLERLGDAVEPALRRLLAGAPSVEVKRRAEMILAKVTGPIADTELLRSLRAVEAMENIGTPEAIQVLETLANGGTEARLTREAKAALERKQR